MNLTALFNDVHEAVLRAATAQGAWSEIVGIVEKTGLSIPPAVRDSDLASQVRELAKQLRDLFERTPLPQDLTFIYFGLFTAANPVTFEEEAGFYVAGGTSNDPEVDLSEGGLTYFPEDPYLKSELLDQVKAAALADEENYQLYDYVLMLGAAATLARFAIQGIEPPRVSRRRGYLSDTGSGSVALRRQ